MSFGGDLEKFAKRANGNMEMIFQKVVFDMTKSLIDMSPVDTGRFRANWMIGIGQPINLANNLKTNASNALSRAAARIHTVQIGQTVWITNALPYAQRLEYGYSKQAPGGMVRITAARFSKFVSAAAVGLK